MNDDVRPVLTQLVQQEGSAFYGDPRRAEALLKDLVGHRQGEIFVLITALRAGVADELLASRPGLVEVSVNRLSERLTGSFGMDPDASRWAVAAWASALGVGDVAPSPQPPPPTAPPAAPPPPPPPPPPPAAFDQPTQTAGVRAAPPPVPSPPMAPSSPRRSSAWLPWLLVGAAAVVVIAALVAVLGNKASGGDIFLSSDRDPGANAFTPDASAPPPARVTAPSLPAPAQQGAVASTNGSQPGLYGGTLNSAGCDVSQLVDALTKDPAKADAFAAVPRIRRDQIPAYVNSLTPVILLADTRVTSHGFSNGQSTSFQAALQAGSTALVDTYGSPRVRCTGGNPLTAPVAVRSSPTYRGLRWPGFSPTTLVVVDPSTTAVDAFVLVDVTSGQRFSRPAGSQGDRDASS